MYLRGYRDKVGLLSVIKRIIAALAVALIAGVGIPSAVLAADDEPAQEPLHVFSSPDNAYHLSVYEKPGGFMSFGDSSDKGYIVLRDASGRELARSDVEVVDMIDVSSVRWYDNEVDIKNVVVWSLPGQDKAAP